MKTLKCRSYKGHGGTRHLTPSLEPWLEPKVSKMSAWYLQISKKLDSQTLLNWIQLSKLLSHMFMVTSEDMKR